MDYRYLFVLSLLAAADGCSRGGWRRSRRKDPLIKGERYPSNSRELSMGASGATEGAIEPHSPDYTKKLKLNSNKNIEFRMEEGTQEDRLMTKNCMEKLDKLAKLVMSKWDGRVKLMVLEAYDVRPRNGPQRHASDSLHYEGRAVDVIVSDNDRGKLGTLGRLAVNAGFDWVHYIENHIHASVKSDSQANSGWTGCFRDTNYVTLPSGSRKYLHDVTQGDVILTGTAEGRGVFSEVIGFLDRESDVSIDFTQVSLANGVKLELTPSHLVYRVTDGQEEAVFAKHLQPGDHVIHISTNGTQVITSVIKTRLIHGRGFVAPLTVDGNIVVQGVKSSCYALIESHSLAHWSVAPLRWWHWAWSVASRGPRGPVSIDEHGVPVYAQLLHTFARLVLPSTMFSS